MTMESASAAGSLRYEKCSSSRHVIPLYFMYLPNHSSASENSVPLPGAAAAAAFAPELRVLSLVQRRGARRLAARSWVIPTYESYTGPGISRVVSPCLGVAFPDVGPSRKIA